MIPRSFSSRHDFRCDESVGLCLPTDRKSTSVNIRSHVKIRDASNAPPRARVRRTRVEFHGVYSASFVRTRWRLPPDLTAFSADPPGGPRGATPTPFPPHSPADTHVTTAGTAPRSGSVRPSHRDHNQHRQIRTHTVGAELTAFSAGPTGGPRGAKPAPFPPHSLAR
jgi:hypothetical protein